jgi:hypothetical protein
MDGCGHDCIGTTFHLVIPPLLDHYHAASAAFTTVEADARRYMRADLFCGRTLVH